MSKHYFPELEEFHVGFVFDALPTDPEEDTVSWKSFKFHQSKDGVFFKSMDYPWILERLELKRIRVKHLDSDDIVDAGFVRTDQPGEFRSMNRYRGLSTGDDGYYMISYSDDRISDVSIWRQSNRGEETPLFEGIIKNKSKFAEVLEMLRIEPYTLTERFKQTTL